jgi:hypothetical protein
VTIPNDIILPVPNETTTNTPESLNRYLVELVRSLEDMYRELSEGSNGDFRTSFSDENRIWTPTIKDTADSTTTFTYTRQIGWVLRKGLVVDAWFDVQWTAVAGGTINGKMFLELPYKIAITDSNPFSSSVRTSTFAYTGGTSCFMDALSDTFRGDIWNSGSGFSTARQDSRSAGRIIGHIRYIGQQDE